jgi:hypothetical protein
MNGQGWWFDKLTTNGMLFLYLPSGKAREVESSFGHGTFAPTGVP